MYVCLLICPAWHMGAGRCGCLAAERPVLISIMGSTPPYRTSGVISFLRTKTPSTSIPVAVRPTNGSRISSSYSPSGVQTGVFRAAAGCTAAAVSGQNLTPRAACFENATV